MQEINDSGDSKLSHKHATARNASDGTRNQSGFQAASRSRRGIYETATSPHCLPYARNPVAGRSDLTDVQCQIKKCDLDLMAVYLQDRAVVTYSVSRATWQGKE
jgi:hypothetical protein